MKAVLGLEDGTVVKGVGFGAAGAAVCGELVFSTQYTGYEEALTDPSYAGQILMFTYPLIGNYGVSGNTFQSDGMKAEALVVREACDHPSHHLSKRSIFDFAKDEGRPGIADVDTRMLTIKTRNTGAMRACLLTDSDDGEEAVRMARQHPKISDHYDLIDKVTCPAPYHIEAKGKYKPHFVVIDLGIKTNIIKSLQQRGVGITVVPANTPTDYIIEQKPDAIFVSNGPGDPEKATNAIDVVKNMMGQVPIYGICFGNQIISLALGASTYKLKFGHRGANQPVKDLEKGTVYITSQNHGFAVDGNSLDGAEAYITHINVNDKTVEGIAHNYLDIMSVQFHPEASPGPWDTEKWFFDTIVKREMK
ncbi:MAG: glutamine-hydrolyzing carbamoyl-phosphate synthase small subunit [Methanosarcinales archaeon]|nr:glutamine-hydrolyzing carbamoyl-phosphate synthase small subunit [Methanosarcinales archaeon]